MKDTSRTVLALGLGAALLLGPAACGRRPPPTPPRPVVRYERAKLVSEAGLTNVQTYLGTVRCHKEMDLSFKVGGIVELLGPEAGEDWKEGVPASAGTVLARLKQADLINAVSREEARAQMNESLMASSRKLLEQKAISPQEWDIREANHKEAQALLAQARQALSDSELKAQFPGTILARYVNSGQTVQPGQAVLRFGDLRLMEIDLGVPDRIVGAIVPRQAIPFSISALEWTNFVGHVSEVGVAAKEGTRLFKIVLQVTNSAALIKSGMTASVWLAEPTPASPTAVLVPLSALVAAAGPASGARATPLAVFVVGDEGKAHERRVQTGDIIRSSIEVLAGLKAGEKVVVVGASLLHDGQPVDARPVEAVSP